MFNAQQRSFVKYFPTETVCEALSLARVTTDTPETQNEANFAACYTSIGYRKPPFHREREKEQERRAFSSKTTVFVDEFNVLRKQTRRVLMNNTTCSYDQRDTSRDRKTRFPSGSKSKCCKDFFIRRNHQARKQIRGSPVTDDPPNYTLSTYSLLFRTCSRLRRNGSYSYPMSNIPVSSL